MAKAAGGCIGRVFVVHLEDGDVVPTCLEEKIKLALGYFGGK